jgi:hypothetical protein
MTDEPILRLRHVESLSVDDGEIVALDLKESQYYGINDSGAPLWQALQTGATLSELARILVTTYDVDGEVGATDAAEFVEALRRRGLLTETAP